MDHVGERVFARKEYNHDGEDVNDIWDDTALIQAYDTAVTAMKARLPNNVQTADVKQKQPSKSSRKKKNRKGNPKQNSVRKSQSWLVGDHCRAVFTEDGKIYEGMILSIDNSNNSCVVRYLGYGNEEEQELVDLLPSIVAESHRHSQSPSVTESESGLSSQQQTGYRRRSSTASSRRMPAPPSPAQFLHGPTPPTFMPQSSQFPFQATPFPAMPLLPPPFLNNPFQSGAGLPGHPPMPQVPPPPPVDAEGITDDKEALHSMLISWYMSGYHTGYYQGLKEGRKNQSKTSANREKSQDASETS